MTMITGRDAVNDARILALRSMLRLEIRTGMTRRGRSAYQIVKQEFGFRGNKKSVLNQLDAWIEKNIWKEGT